MTIHVLGNIYKGEFQYQDSDTTDFRRLLLTDITGENNEIGIMTQITTREPKEPPTWFDQYKMPLHKYAEYGLSKMSYVRVNKNFALPLNVLSKPIGKMNDDEFIPIALAVNAYMREHGFQH